VAKLGVFPGGNSARPNIQVQEEDGSWADYALFDNILALMSAPGSENLYYHLHPYGDNSDFPDGNGDVLILPLPRIWRLEIEVLAGADALPYSFRGSYLL
jgi:hypothetical protein